MPTRNSLVCSRGVMITRAGRPRKQGAQSAFSLIVRHCCVRVSARVCARACGRQGALFISRHVALRVLRILAFKHPRGLRFAKLIACYRTTHATKLGLLDCIT